MPLFGYWWAIYPALALLLLIALRQKPLLAYGTGMLAILIAGIFLAGHITNAAHIANLTAGLGSLSQLIGLTLCLVSAGKNLSPKIQILFTASAGVTSEWIMSHFLPTSISISHHANLYALKLASLIGIWGVTFIIWFAAACLGGIIYNRKHAIRSSIAVLSILILLILYTSTTLPDSNISKIRVAAIQGYGSFTLSEETSKLHGKIDIAVWSENGMNPDEPDVYQCARTNSIYIAANFVEKQPDDTDMNISYLISPKGKIAGKCRKQHLFGKELLEFSQSKKECTAIDITGLKIGLPTCYDTMFTDVIREYVREGAGLILVPNSDPEAPNHFFARMHAAMTAFRAAENAVPVVMADTGSISTIFDPSGRVIAESEHGKPGYTMADIPLRNKTTLYNRIGDLLAYLCFAFILLIFYSLRKRSQD